MFKEGVRDILEKLDNDLVGLIPVKRRVREIAALLVLDKVKDRPSFQRSLAKTSTTQQRYCSLVLLVTGYTSRPKKESIA